MHFALNETLCLFQRKPTSYLTNNRQKNFKKKVSLGKEGEEWDSFGGCTEVFAVHYMTSLICPALPT